MLEHRSWEILVMSLAPQQAGHVAAMLEPAPMAYPSVGLNLNYELLNRGPGESGQKWQDQAKVAQVAWGHCWRCVQVLDRSEMSLKKLLNINTIPFWPYRMLTTCNDKQLLQGRWFVGESDHSYWLLSLAYEWTRDGSDEKQMTNSSRHTNRLDLLYMQLHPKETWGELLEQHDNLEWGNRNQKLSGLWWLYICTHQECHIWHTLFVGNLMNSEIVFSQKLDRQVLSICEPEQERALTTGSKAPWGYLCSIHNLFQFLHVDLVSSILLPQLTAKGTTKPVASPTFYWLKVQNHLWHFQQQVQVTSNL